MAGVNKVILLGNLGADPELRYTQSGTAVANLRLATSSTYTDKAGQKVDQTEWHRVVCFGKLAEICGEYLHKGKQVYFEGRIQTKQWEDKAGVKRYTTEIVANQMQMLGRPGDKPEEVPSGGASSEEPPQTGEPEPPELDDVPF